MCGRYVTEDDTSVDMSALYHELSQSYPDIRLKSGEIFPTDTVPLLCGKELIPLPATWGYPGFQNKGVIINARSESVADKPTFRDGFLNHRCIVPTNGYYEWSRSKVKYRFNLPDTQMVYLAGIYRNTPEGIRFVILTTDANESVSPIHHRMPVILTPDMRDAWMYSAREALDCLRTPIPLLNPIKANS